MPRSACLLRSRRRSFLFFFHFHAVFGFGENGQTNTLATPLGQGNPGSTTAKLKETQVLKGDVTCLECVEIKSFL